MKKLRIVALMLIFAMCFCVNCSAKTDEEVIKSVGDAEIMQGTQNGFEPEKTLTRAEITTIVIRMKDMEDDALTECTYDDVSEKHWAYNYIALATKNGITEGTGNNKFSPDKEVTVAEAVTMVIRAIADYETIENNGSWPDNYMNFAHKYDLLDGVEEGKNDVIRRISTARIIDNVLTSPNWNDETKDDDKDEEVDNDGKVIISKAAEGVIVSVSETYDDYNEIELATPYGIINLIAHDSELTSGTVLPGTYADFWLSGDRMWDINVQPVTGITPTYNIAKVVKFGDGIVRIIHKKTDDEELVTKQDAVYMNAGNIIFLKCEEMVESDLGDGKILRDFNSLEFGNEIDIELATDYENLKYSEIDATEIFYQSREIDDEESIIAMIYAED